MTALKYVFAGVAMLIGTAVSASAQYQPWPYVQTYPYNPAPSTPPSWSYDPYTTGEAGCVQRGRHDPPCWQTVRPTAGQPNYWIGE